MVQGLDRREVTGSVEQQVRGKQVEDSRVPLSPVMAPRPSSMAGTGKAGALMAEAGKWGGQFFSEMIDRENRKSLLEGQALYAQGKTLEDLKKDGANAFTEQGFRLMDAQVAASQWHATMQEKIKQEDFSLSPDEYRQRTVSQLADFTKGKDPDSVGMIMATSMKFLPDLVEKQTAANFAHRENETYRSTVGTVSSAKSVLDTSGNDVGKSDWLATLTHEDSPVMKLKPERRGAAIVEGIRAAYESGNPLAHQWAQEAGLLPSGPAPTGPQKGMVEHGTIDLAARPMVKNEDGSISTVRSMSFNDGKREVLIPTVVEGKVVSDKEAIDHYRKTGQHLGKFDTPEAATAYAEKLHTAQEQFYLGDKKSPVDATGMAVIREAESGYYIRKEREFDEKLTLWEQDLKKRVRKREITFPEALAEDRKMQESMGLRYGAEDAKALVASDNAAQAAADAEARADKRQREADAKADARQTKHDAETRQDAIVYTRWRLQMDEYDKKLTSGEWTPLQYVQKGEELSKELGMKYNAGRAGGLLSEIDKARHEAEQERQYTLAIDTALAKGTITDLDPKMRQDAMRIQQDRIAKHWMDKGAQQRLSPEVVADGIKTDWLEFWDRTGVVDKQSQDRITAFARSGGLQSDGTVSKAGIATFQGFIEMYNKNPKLALEHVHGEDEKVRLLTYAKHYNGDGGFSEAIREGALALERKDPLDAMAKQAREAEQFGWKGIGLHLPFGSRNEIDEQVRRYMDDRKSGWVGNLFSKHDLQAKTGWLYSSGWLRNKEADVIQEKYVPALKENIATKAADIVASGRTKDYGVATEMAATDILGRTVVMGNTMITSPVGKHPLDMMFGPGGSSKYTKPDVPSDALRLAVQQLGRSKWREEYDRHTPGMIALNPVDTIDEARRGPPLEVVRDPRGEGVFVRFEKVNGEMSARQHFSFRELGVVYEAHMLKSKAVNNSEDKSRWKDTAGAAGDAVSDAADTAKKFITPNRAQY